MEKPSLRVFLSLLAVTVFAVGIGLLICACSAFDSQTVAYITASADGEYLQKYGDRIHSDRLREGTYYHFDVLFLDEAGNTMVMPEHTHRINGLEPGQSNDRLTTELIEENGQVIGYRITTENESAYIEITVKDENDQFIHQMTLWIRDDEAREMLVMYAYNFEPDIPTGELIDKVLSQHMGASLYSLSSSELYYPVLVDYQGGYAELEKRADTAVELLERYERIKNGESLYPSAIEGFPDTDSSVEFLLSEHYIEKLTEKQLERLFEIDPEMTVNEPTTEPAVYRETAFIYELPLCDTLLAFQQGGYTASANYDAEDITEFDFYIAKLIDSDGKEKYGYRFEGVAVNNAEFLITILDKNDFLVLRQTVRVACTDDGYEIHVAQEDSAPEDSRPH